MEKLPAGRQPARRAGSWFRNTLNEDTDSKMSEAAWIRGGGQVYLR
jgi:hypothetical protein